MLFESLNLSIVKRYEYEGVNDYVIKITNTNTNKSREFTHCESPNKNDEQVLMGCLESLYNSHYAYFEECSDVYDFIYIHLYDDEEEGAEAYEITKKDAVAFNELVDANILNKCEELFS